MTDLEVYQPKAPAPVPANGHQDTDSWITVVRDIIRIADVIYDTPFVPDGLRGSSPAVAAAMLAGREMGLGIMTSLANIDVIRGKPTQKALLMRAMILSRGHRWRDGDVTDTRAVVSGCRKGESEWTEVVFTADQAKRAGIDLGRYPADKLYARATSRLARRKFADVIMGMPYSAEELEDGEVRDDAPAPAAKQDGNGHKPAAPAPRTARRKTAAGGRRGEDDQGGEDRGMGADRVKPSGSQRTDPPRPEAPGPAAALPPLPGEDETPAAALPDEQPDETDYDTPGTVTRPQLTAIWTVLTTEFKFSNDEKDQARAVCAHVIGHPLESTKRMSRNEARAVLDTLASWREVAERHEEQPREFLIELLATAEKAGGDD